MASTVLKTVAASRVTPFQLVGTNIRRYPVGLTTIKVTAAKRTMATISNGGVASCPVDGTQALKPYSEMPGPKGLPFIGTLLEYTRKGGFRFNKMFEVMQIRSEQYGPVYKENIGAVTSVVISDPDEYAKVMRGEGKCPNRLEMDPMVHYRKKRGMSLGTVNSQGVEWYRHRAVLNKKMLLPKEVLNYLEPMEEVATDFVSRLHQVRCTDGRIKNIEMEIFMWALESIGTVLFEERIGCFKDPPPAEAKEFITNLVGFFRTLQPLLYSTRLYRIFPTRMWRAHERHADKVVEIGQHYVNKKLEELKRGKMPGEKTSKSAFLTHLLHQKALTPEEVNGHIIDLLMAAVETVSNTLLWTLYCLSTNPSAQDALYAEVARQGKSNQPLNLNDLHYLKACVKETFRLFPVTFATSRVIPEALEIGGYEVPAGSHVQANVFTMGRDPAYFPEPLRFLPDRWLRDGEDYDDDLARRRQLISGLPFGHGSRMCIGRRFAEQELYLILAKLVQNFRIEYIGKTPEPVLNTVLTPDRPLKFTITPRPERLT